MVGSGGTPFGFGFRRRATAVGTVEMWESRQRFPRAVGKEGSRFWVFLVFHPPVISTVLRGFALRRCHHALRLAILASIRLLARCISIAASVSVWDLANLSSSVMLTPGRR